MSDSNDWGDLTVDGRKYDPEVQDPKRGRDSYLPCKGSVHATDNGQTVGYDRYNKCYRPCGKDWTGGPGDVLPVGDKPNDSVIAKAYIELLKSGGCITELLKRTGYHHSSLTSLRVTLTRINKRCNDIVIKEVGRTEWARMRNADELNNLTGLKVQDGWKISPMRQKKEGDDAFSDVLAWMKGN